MLPSPVAEMIFYNNIDDIDKDSNSDDIWRRNKNNEITNNKEVNISKTTWSKKTSWNHNDKIKLAVINTKTTLSQTIDSYYLQKKTGLLLTR